MKKATLFTSLAICGVLGLGLFAAQVTAQVPGKEKGAVNAGQLDQAGIAGKKRGGFKGKLFRYIVQQLELTEAQIAQIKRIKQNARQDARAIIQDENLDKETKKARLAALKETTKAQIANALTDEQKQELQQILEDLRDRFSERRGGNAR
jgi:Spy/CpxP family protein refolding chaperone